MHRQSARYTPCVGAQGLPLLGPRSRKPFPTSKFTTTPLLTVPSDSQTDISTHSANWQAANSQRHALSFPLSIDGIKLAIFVRMNWIGDIRESDSTAYYQLQRASWFLTITHTHTHYTTDCLRLVWVEFNTPSDTIEVISSEAVFTANHLTDTDKQNSTGKYKQTQYKSEKVDNLKYSKTKLPWFSCLWLHSARKRGGLILHRPRAHTGRTVYTASHYYKHVYHTTLTFSLLISSATYLFLWE